MFIIFQNFNIQIILKNDKTTVAYFVEYTVEKFEKFLII
jgi:ATP-dependent Clp protease adapter protein ClpS